MKRTELKEIKTKNINDLKSKIEQLRKELAEISIEKSLGKLKDVHSSRTKRKGIAQILTIITQKEFEFKKVNTHQPAIAERKAK